MNLPRPTRIIFVLVLALLPFFSFAALSVVATNDRVPPLAHAEIPSAVSAAGRQDKPDLPVIYESSEQTLIDIPSETAAARSAVMADKTITNAEDIVYLVNSRQMARTRDFSDSSPAWESIISPTSSINGTAIYDFILDPSDPYHVAFAVGNTGIWRTTNLNDRWPDWQNVRSMYAITSSLPPGSFDPQASVSRIASDASRPDYFIVVLGVNTGGDESQHAWVGYTLNKGSGWS